MSDLSVRSLIGPMIKATREGKLSWEEDPSGGYLVRLGPHVVNIYESEGRNWDPITVRVVNEMGRVVDFHEFGADASDFEDVRDLYAMARKMAMKSDQVLGDILSQLDASS